jgi:predicted MFS family arabinose efflux permease
VAPISLVTVAMVLIGLRADEPGERMRLNVGCFAGAAVGLSGVLYVLGEAPEVGWGEPRILIVAVLAGVALISFVAIELRTSNPLIGLQLFREPVFRFCNIATALQTLAFLGGMYYDIPLLLQEVGGRSPFEAGLVLSSVPIGVVLSTQTIGRAYDVLGPRAMVVTGQTLLAVVLLVLSRFNGQAPLWAFCLVMFFAGLTNGMGMVSLQATIFANTTPRSLARGATVLNVNRQVATAIGVGIATAVITAGGAGASTHDGPYRIALLIAAGCSMGAALAGLALPGRAVHPDPQPAPEVAPERVGFSPVAG